MYILSIELKGKGGGGYTIQLLCRSSSSSCMEKTKQNIFSVKFQYIALCVVRIRMMSRAGKREIESWYNILLKMTNKGHQGNRGNIQCIRAI